ncbi:hypothetical protein PAMP_015535 [Pampus punctatissimus]
MATNVFITNQQPQPSTLIAVQSNQWSTGLCDCFNDLNVCCFAYWCFPCFTCNTASNFGECFCLPLLDIVWSSMQLVSITPCTPPISLAMRVAVRHHYGIQGDITTDCMFATFCNMCSWCQISREIKRRRQMHTVINAQPVFMGAQHYMVTNQPGVITSQPVISAAPQAVLTSI